MNTPTKAAIDAAIKRCRDARIRACGAWSEVADGGSINVRKCNEASKAEDELAAAISELSRLALAAVPDRVQPDHFPEAGKMIDADGVRAILDGRSVPISLLAARAERLAQEFEDGTAAKDWQAWAVEALPILRHASGVPGAGKTVDGKE